MRRVRRQVGLDYDGHGCSGVLVGGVVHRRRCSAGGAPAGDRSRRSPNHGDPPEPYEFLSDQVRDASAKYGVSSVSVLAVKPGA